MVDGSETVDLERESVCMCVCLLHRLPYFAFNVESGFPSDFDEKRRDKGRDDDDDSFSSFYIQPGKEAVSRVCVEAFVCLLPVCENIQEMMNWIVRLFLFPEEKDFLLLVRWCDDLTL